MVLLLTEPLVKNAEMKFMGSKGLDITCVE